MTYVWFELVILALWTGVFANRARRHSLSSAEDLHVLVFSLATTVIMEARNEYLQASVGTYYPASLAYFPGFKFPVAIILAGSLLSWVVYAGSRLIASRFVRPESSYFRPIQLLLFLVILGGSFLIEYLGVRIGYWQWRVYLPSSPAIWLGKYLYYLRFCLPPALVAIFFSWYLKKRPVP